MNRERAKELLPIMQAFVDGAQIQYKVGENNWFDTDYLSCGGGLYKHYRIKPQPKECWISRKDMRWCNTKCYVSTFLKDSDAWVHFREVLK